MRCVCWRSQGKVFQTKRNASIGARKDKFPKNYGLLPDGRIPADPPKDALRLREGERRGERRGRMAGARRPHYLLLFAFWASPEALLLAVLWR